jgi:ketohexokinase
MACVLGIGIATLDVINEVDGYPAEDAEVRALDQHLVPGGNATNTLTVLALLGHQCRLGASLADDPEGQRVRRELAGRGIDTAGCTVHPRGKTPTSYICLNRRNGSRTIVHYRDLPELGYDDFRRLDLDGVRWLHFEGRNVAQTRRMITRARTLRPRVRISVEIEKPHEGIESLFAGASVLLFSRPFARERGFQEAGALLAWARGRAPTTDLICAWGEAGAFALDSEGVLHHRPAVPPAALVDTRGAGDAFNAAAIDALLRGQGLLAALEHANRLAGAKCGMRGFDGLSEFRAMLP